MEEDSAESIPPLKTTKPPTPHPFTRNVTATYGPSHKVPNASQMTSQPNSVFDWPRRTASCRLLFLERPHTKLLTDNKQRLKRNLVPEAIKH